MDFIIEIIVEIFGEILVEGIKFLATSDKIPKFIRIAVMIIISAALLRTCSHRDDVWILHHNFCDYKAKNRRLT